MILFFAFHEGLGDATSEIVKANPPLKGDVPRGGGDEGNPIYMHAWLYFDVTTAYSLVSVCAPKVNGRGVRRYWP